MTSRAPPKCSCHNAWLMTTALSLTERRVPGQDAEVGHDAEHVEVGGTERDGVEACRPAAVS